jgi:aldose sugar dehydrogenase
MRPRLEVPVRIYVSMIAALLSGASSCGSNNDTTIVQTPGQSGALRVETITTGLDTPWDLALGPDGAIWFTERPGTISRLDLTTRRRTRVGQVAVAQSSESGLMGMAFHPDFASQPFVYVAHSYSSGGSIRNRLVRMRYDGSQLGAPQTLVDNIPGGSIHDGSRLVVGPDRLLYMTTGDAGNGSNAQDRASLAGKILRLTLDGAPAPGNAFTTAIYTYGHRNPQGIVFSPSGVLYASEHGPGEDDEVNRIEAGRNHGWPNVEGFCDNDVSSSEKSFCSANNVVEPLAAWSPTIAPSGLAYYDATLIAGWKGSLLMTSLKDNALYRLQLSSDGSQITSRERLFAGDFGRLRDVLVGPRGEIYLATSNHDGRGNPKSDDDRIVKIEP